MLQEILQNTSPIYPLWATFMLVLSLILVDRKSYQYLLPHGLLGAIITSLILLININIIKAWEYVEIEPYSVIGVTIFIFTAWIAAIIIFLWALPKRTPIWVHFLYIGLFSILGAALDNIFHNLGLRPYADWYSGWMWFFVLYLNFWIHYKVYLLRLRIDDLG